WLQLINQFFAPDAIIHFQLTCEENENVKTRSFELNPHTLAHYFYFNRKSGIIKQCYSMENPTEHMLGPLGRLLECDTTTVLDVHKNGTKVHHEAGLSIYFNTQNLIDLWEFRTHTHIELLPRVFVDTLRNSSHHNTMGSKKLGSGKGGDNHPKLNSSMTLIPESPVTGYGVPEQTIRTLEISETLNHMKDIMAY
ncbi:LIM-domain binding protein, partial [Dimargaris cristalligena]